MVRNIVSKNYQKKDYKFTVSITVFVHKIHNLRVHSGTIMTISKDRVKPSPVPDSWKLKEIFATGVVLGGYLALGTVLFFWLVKDTDFFSVSTHTLANGSFHRFSWPLESRIYVPVCNAGEVWCEIFEREAYRNNGSVVPASEYCESSSHFRDKVPQLVLRWTPRDVLTGRFPHRSARKNLVYTILKSTMITW